MEKGRIKKTPIFIIIRYALFGIFGKYVKYFNNIWLFVRNVVLLHRIL